MYRYETHLHTFPVSRCAQTTVKEALAFYQQHQYAGVFITNHFLDGNLNADPSLSYEERIRFFFSDYEEGKALASEYSLSVFCGIEMTYRGSDFLVYGLDQNWFMAHPEIMSMEKSKQLPFLAQHGALVIHAHPFREAFDVDHIRLYPRAVHGVEVYNGKRTDFENNMALQYATNYGLIPFAGTDNHHVAQQRRLGGMEFLNPIQSEFDFIARVKRGEGKIFQETIS